MNPKIINIIFLVVGLFGLTLNCYYLQNPYALEITIKEGLPSNNVFQTYQDSKGFIWLATNEGLTRYDGFQFKSYTCPEQTSLAGSCIKEDHLGRIWYENFDGNIYYVDEHHTKLQPFNNTENLGFLPFGITAKYIYITTLHGQNIYDINELKLKKKISLPSFNTQHATHSASAFYYINESTLYAINDDLSVKKEELVFSEENMVKLIFWTPNNQLAVYTKYNEKKKVYFYNDQLRLIDSLSIPEPDFIQNFTCIDNKYWISTTKGIYVYSYSGELLNHYYPDKSVSGVFKDRQNNYWFSTTNEGVFLVPRLENQIISLGNILPSRMVFTSDNKVIIATKKGDIISSTFDLSSPHVLYTTPDSSEIYFLNYDSIQGNIYFSAKGFYDLHSPYSKANNYGYSIKDICQLDRKYFAYAASSILGLFKSRDGVETIFSVWDKVFEMNTFSDNKFSYILSSIRAKSVVYDSTNTNIYYATNQGIYKVTPNQILEIKHDEASFFANKLIFFDQSLYALSTKGNLFKIVGDQFEYLNTQLGFPENGIKMCYCFEEQLVLVGKQFISLYDLLAKTTSTFGVNVAPYEINDLVLKDSSLYVLTNSGVIKTHINSHHDVGAKPLFHWQASTASNQPILEGAVNELAYTDNYITINYSILDFGKIMSETLYYRINESDWEPTSSLSRNIVFPSLSTGFYSIEFMLGNEVLPDKIEFTILPPFWKRGWFITVVIILIVTIGWLYYKYQMKLLFVQIKLLREKIQLERNLSKSVLTSIKSQMNPHFFYNALNTIQAYIFTNDTENAGKYLSKFSKLTRKILEMSEQELVTLSEEVETLQLYLEIEQIRFENDFFYTIEVDSTVESELIHIPPMLIQPFVENAIKHGLLHLAGEKLLSLRFERKSDNLTVTIDDNGVGRKRSMELNAIRHQKHKSFASDANAKRLEMLNQGRKNTVGLTYIDKENELGQPLGTTVIVTIPLNF